MLARVLSDGGKGAKPESMGWEGGGKDGLDQYAIS
jgi:hypothetical protein